MGSFTSCQAIEQKLQNQSSGSEDSELEEGQLRTWHGFTHFLSSQQVQSGSKDSEKRYIIQLNLPWNHSQTDMPTEPEWEGE